jgi:hypothetical protein
MPACFVTRSRAPRNATRRHPPALVAGNMPPLFQYVSGHFQALEKQKNIIGAKELHSLESEPGSRMLLRAHVP